MVVKFGIEETIISSKSKKWVRHVRFVRVVPWEHVFPKYFLLTSNVDEILILYLKYRISLNGLNLRIIIKNNNKQYIL